MRKKVGDLVSLPVLMVLLMSIVSGCGANNNKEDQTKQNPDPEIKDDYSHLTDIQHYKKWGPYNVHDPTCIKAGNYYYTYSTDAIYWPEGANKTSDSISIGNVQVRRSKDLVDWEFRGWAFDSIPQTSFNHVNKASGGKKPNGIWAPYITEHNGQFRLYYSVSVFGANTSCIGLATSDSPEGPWKQQGIVVATDSTDKMNAIDPTIVNNHENDKQWMIYGSFFGGLYALELNPETGLAMNPDTLGKCVAKRANGDDEIIEAPEVIYNPEFDKYYMFVAYDPLFTHYNVRVGRADKPQGPYYDMQGVRMDKPTNNRPVLTFAYRFKGHPGWAGVGHPGVINDNGNFFMLHQGRLAPDNQMMVMHVRKIFWNDDGWPAVSPQRYAGVNQQPVNANDIIGKWEHIHVQDLKNPFDLWQGQVMGEEFEYDTNYFNNARYISFKKDRTIKGWQNYKWKIKNRQLQILNRNNRVISNLHLTWGWDWENNTKTLLYTGLSPVYASFWGKRVGDINN